jgi:oxygen-independent coproporphyrinogen-3 oxidase
MEIEKLYIERKFNINFDKYFHDALVKLQPLADDNLLEITDSKLIVSPLGRLLIRNIAMCFDAYLDQMMKEKPIFSRTV